MRGELEALLSGPGEEDTLGRIGAAVAAFQALKDAPGPEPVAVHVAAEPEPAPPPAAVVVPLPSAVEETLTPVPNAPAAQPAWSARVRESGRPARQASLFDPPRPVAPEPDRRAAAATGESWRAAVAGRPTQLRLI